jgi:hypothetical protein
VITVKIENATGRGHEIRIIWDDSSYSHGLTNGEGSALFDDAMPGYGTIYVDGRKAHSGQISRITRIQKR